MTILKAIKTDRGVYVDGYNEGGATEATRTLAAGVAESITVPDGLNTVLIQSNQDLFYNLAATASVPTGDTYTGTLLPAPERRFIDVTGTTTISVISSGAAIVTALFWD